MPSSIWPSGRSKIGFPDAGGTHDDFATYDRVMREERRTAVFVHPDRVYGNPAR